MAKIRWGKILWMAGLVLFLVLLIPKLNYPA